MRQRAVNNVTIRLNTGLTIGDGALLGAGARVARYLLAFDATDYLHLELLRAGNDLSLGGEDEQIEALLSSGHAW